MSGPRAIVEAFNAALRDRYTPGFVDRDEAGTLIDIASVGTVARRARAIATLEDIVTSRPDRFERRARRDILRFLGMEPLDAPPASRGDRVLIDWRASKPTWHCHWFPMRETRPGGGDPMNNLFAPGGALEKYDQAFGAYSQEYELENNFRGYDSDAPDADWAGHCNNASEVACLLDPPRHDVVYNGVRFTRQDICGLIVKISDLLASRVDFEGERYNGLGDENADPSPYDFLEILSAWTDDDMPFVMDIDRKEQVWNYPYDSATVTESAAPPQGFDPRSLPSGGTTRFYRFDLSGTGFDAQAQSYRAWIHRSPDGEVTSGWIENGNRSVNPDFLWRSHPHGRRWRGRAVTNPEVVAESVYELYRRSIA